MWTAIISALAAGLKLVGAVFGANNSKTMQDAKAADTESKVDQANTAAVEKAIETGDVTGLQK